MNEAVAEVANAVATRSASGFSIRRAPKNAGLAAAPRLGDFEDEPAEDGDTDAPEKHDRDHSLLLLFT